MIPLSYTNTSLSQINRVIPSLSHQVVRFASGGSRWKFWSKSKENVDDAETEKTVEEAVVGHYDAVDDHQDDDDKDPDFNPDHD